MSEEIDLEGIQIDDTILKGKIHKIIQFIILSLMVLSTNIFTIFKFMGIISWSWIWVTSPIWIGIIIVIIISSWALWDIFHGR